MSRTLVFVLGIACFSLCWSAHEGYCAIYKYVDSGGLVNFADNLQSIPDQYRSTAVIVGGGGEEPGTSSGKPSDSTAANSPVHPGSSVAVADQREEVAPSAVPGPASFARRATISAIVVASVIFLFSILRIVDRDERKSLAVARIVLLWGVTVFVLYMHVGDLLRFVGLMGDSVQSVKESSEEKGKKAAAAVKSMQMFVDQIHQDQGGVPSPEPSADPGEGK